jgi:hypothetical protein
MEGARCGIVQVPEGFPPRFVYRFSEDGRTLTMPGRDRPTVTLTRRP